MSVEVERDDAIALLVRMGLTASSEVTTAEPLSGGVSSDIWLVRTAERAVVLKRPREQLKVAADWQAPMDRGASEAAWLELRRRRRAGRVPARARLRRGDASRSRSSTSTPRSTATGRRSCWQAAWMPRSPAPSDADLGRIHAASARTAGLAARFDHQDLFESLRIEPYLLRTAAAVPEAREPLAAIVDEPADDADRARARRREPEEHPRGRPAGLPRRGVRHLVRPGVRRRLLPDPPRAQAVPPARACGRRCAQRREAFTAGYLAEVDWEDAADVAARVARIVPALLLARVEGASPAEYLDAADPRAPCAGSPWRRSSAGRAVGGRSSTKKEQRMTDASDPCARVACGTPAVLPTVEAEVTTESGARGRGIAPAGASTGRREAIELRDGGAALGGKDVTQRGRAREHPRRRRAGRARRRRPGGRRPRARRPRPRPAALRGSAAIPRRRSRSRCCTRPPRAAASRRGVLLDPQPRFIPRPQIQILGGGAHAAHRTTVQDFMVMPLSATSIADGPRARRRGLPRRGRGARRARAEARCRRRGRPLARGRRHRGRPRRADGGHRAHRSRPRASTSGSRSTSRRASSTSRAATASATTTLSTAEWIDQLVRICRTYPIVTLEDPADEDDTEGMRRAVAGLGARTLVVGDDYLVTSAARIRQAAADAAVDAVLIKVNQIGTVTGAAERDPCGARERSRRHRVGAVRRERGHLGRTPRDRLGRRRRQGRLDHAQRAHREVERAHPHRRRARWPAARAARTSVTHARGGGGDMKIISVEVQRVEQFDVNEVVAIHRLRVSDVAPEASRSESRR